jgi:hypothetical protein
MITDGITLAQPIQQSPVPIKGGLGPLPFVSNQHRLIAEKHKAEAEIRQLRSDLAAARYETTQARQARQRSDDEFLALQIQTSSWRSDAKQDALERSQEINRLNKEVAEYKNDAADQRLLVQRYINLDFANVSLRELRDLELHFQRFVCLLILTSLIYIISLYQIVESMPCQR